MNDHSLTYLEILNTIINIICVLQTCSYIHIKMGGIGMSVLQISTDNGVRVLTLNRPERLNAINDELSTQLEVAITEASSDDDVRVIVLIGIGKGFSSGFDFVDLANKESSANPHAYI